MSHWLWFLQVVVSFVAPGSKMGRSSRCVDMVGLRRGDCSLGDPPACLQNCYPRKEGGQTMVSTVCCQDSMPQRPRSSSDPPLCGSVFCPDFLQPSERLQGLHLNPEGTQ